MENDQFVFTADCVLKLQDFGQLKDYSESVEVLLQSIQNGKIKLDLAEEVLSADPEDIMHIPELRVVVTYLLNHQEQLTDKLKINLLRLTLVILEESFFGYSWGQQFLDNLCKILKKTINQTNISQLILFLHRLSNKIHYLSNQDHPRIVMLFMMLDLKHCQQQKLQYKYMFLVDGFLRSRNIRVLVGQQLKLNKESYLYLRMKINLWKNELKQAEQMLLALEKQNVGKYIQKSLKHWRMYINNYKK